MFTIQSNTEYFPINMHAILASHRPQHIYTHCYQELSPHLGVERKGKSQHYHCKDVRQLSAELADCSLTRLSCMNVQLRCGSAA